MVQEGPHSALNEDEFFDALEMAYQKDEMVRIRLSVAVHVDCGLGHHRGQTLCLLQ